MDALDTAALAIPLVAGPLAAWTVVKRGEQQRESKEEETLQRRLRDQADLAAPMILRGLLNEEDIERVYSYANEVRDGMAPDEEGGWVRCTPGHEKIFLHHGGRMRDAVWRTFPEVCPAVMSKLLDAMHSSPLRASTWKRTSLALQPDLHVRCVEFHKYTAGGGLIDLGHTDIGTSITMSVQLSPPESFQGGLFTTTATDGHVTQHKLNRGDAVIFCSESVHNVQTVEGGTRNSLVVELWTSEPNRVDRFH